MKILFLISAFNSKVRYHPGIASLSAVLKDAGHETDLLSINSLDLSYIKGYVESRTPDVIAVSSNSHQYHYAKEIIPHVRKDLRSAKIILGGVHATLEENVINEIKELDAVCGGEGEMPLLQYVNALESKNTEHNIPNIIFRVNGKIKKNKISFYVEDLNSLPYPDYSIFPLFKKERKLPFPMRFLFNRGCPFNCTYCCNHKFKELFPDKKNYVRYKSPQRVVDELLYFSDLYDFDHYVVDDDIFTLNKKWLLEFSSLYPEKLKAKTFEVNVRVGTVDKDMLKALRSTGCNLIKIGIESGSEALRKQILGRSISQEKIIETANLIKSLGLELHTFNMIGIPNETRRDIWKTIGLNRKINPHKTQLTIYYPYKNTALGDYCYENKIVKKEYADTYFTETIVKTNPLVLTKAEIEHFASFFKFYIYLAKSYKKAYSGLIKGIKSYLSKIKQGMRKWINPLY